ncbi:MAG TPA: type II toxin-antitoxin system RelE/ParE family toxin [Mucilaginibacter sp.]|jgi:plasmid stabilization system protein ParE
MTWKLTYYDEVAFDVRDAKKWYFKQQKGLEKQFAEDVKKCLNRLQKDPLHYEVRYRQVRIAYCTIFPYAIHFYTDEPAEQIVIIAIVHQHRNPAVAKNR